MVSCFYLHSSLARLSHIAGVRAAQHSSRTQRCRPSSTHTPREYINKQVRERESGAESDSVRFAPRERRRISDFSYLSCACVAVSLALVTTAQQLSSLTFIICGWCCKWLSSVVFIATVCFWGGSWPSSTHTHTQTVGNCSTLSLTHTHTRKQSLNLLVLNCPDILMANSPQ